MAEFKKKKRKKGERAFGFGAESRWAWPQNFSSAGGVTAPPLGRPRALPGALPGSRARGGELGAGGGGPRGGGGCGWWSLGGGGGVRSCQVSHRELLSTSHMV